MTRSLLFPGLLDTGAVFGPVLTVRDGFINVHIIKGAGGLVCVDTGFSGQRVTRGFRALGLDVRDVAAVFLTHLHRDHSACASIYPNAEVFVGVNETGPFYWKESKLPRPLARVREGDVVKRAGVSAQVIETPGHTVGSVSYLINDEFLFPGDTLRLREGEVAPFFWLFNHSTRKNVASIRKLAGFAGVKGVFTSHSGFTLDVSKAFRRWRPE